MVHSIAVPGAERVTLGARLLIGKDLFAKDFYPNNRSSATAPRYSAAMAAGVQCPRAPGT
jgi:hypothetical protein